MNDVLLLNIPTKKNVINTFMRMKTEYVYIYQIETNTYMYVCISYICLAIPFLNDTDFFNARQGKNI